MERIIVYPKPALLPCIVWGPAALTIGAFFAFAIASTACKDGSPSAALVAAGTVTVVTDASSYAPAVPITARVVNATASPVTPNGGIVCQGSPWPFTIERMIDDGTWHTVTYGRTEPCVGIDAAALAANGSYAHTFAAPLEAGTYRAVYAYSVNDDGSAVADSVPFQVMN
jgi:hypothetical protein